MTKTSPSPPILLSPQQFFLAGLTLAIATACIHAIQSAPIRTIHSDYVFPEEIPLPGWLPAAPGTESESDLGDVDSGVILPAGIEIAATRYVYRSDSSEHDRGDRSAMELTIEMRYFTDSNGDAKSYIHQLSGDMQSALQERDGVGTYGVYVAGDRAYATACINSAGGSTVLSDNFRSNRYRHDFRPTRMWNWALGRSGIQDRRCLWAHLAIKHDSSTSSESATDLVETAWLDLFEQWNSNYPNS